MEFDNNTADIISIIVVLFSIFLSFSRGLIRECYTIIAWVLSFFSSLQFGPMVLPLILGVPFLEELLLGNCPLAMLLSYVITFVLSLTFFSVLISFLNITKINAHQSIMSIIDKFGGILFGFIRSIFILLLILICFQDIFPNFNFKTTINLSIQESYTFKFLEPSKNYLSKLFTDNGEKWLNTTYEFILQNDCKKRITL